MSEVGDNIKRVRTARKMSQKALADKVGVSQGTIGGLESGTTASTKFLPHIAKALGVRADELDPQYSIEGASIGYQPTDRTPLVPSFITYDRPIPIYSASSFGLGPFERKERPISQIERPPVLKHSPEAYAQLVSWDIMSPELGPGDIIFVNPDLPSLRDTTCIFYQNDTLQTMMVGHLDHISKDAWAIIMWNVDGSRREMDLRREEWPVCHRIVAKHYRT